MLGACRDANSAKAQFGVATGEAGVVVTRTGRRFLGDAGIETELLDRLRAALVGAAARISRAASIYGRHQRGQMPKPLPVSRRLIWRKADVLDPRLGRR